MNSITKTFLLSTCFAATLAACGGGGQAPSPAPVKATITASSSRLDLQAALESTSTDEVVLQNTTTSASSVSLLVSGAQASEFAATGCSSLPAGGSCTVKLSFAPQAWGDRSATLTATAGGTDVKIDLIGRASYAAPASLLTVGSKDRFLTANLYLIEPAVGRATPNTRLSLPPSLFSFSADRTAGRLYWAGVKAGSDPLSGECTWAAIDLRTHIAKSAKPCADLAGDAALGFMYSLTPQPNGNVLGLATDQTRRRKMLVDIEPSSGTARRVGDLALRANFAAGVNMSVVDKDLAVIDEDGVLRRFSLADARLLAEVPIGYDASLGWITATPLERADAATYLAVVAQVTGQAVVERVIRFDASTNKVVWMSAPLPPGPDGATITSLVVDSAANLLYASRADKSLMVWDLAQFLSTAKLGTSIPPAKITQLPADLDIGTMMLGLR